jgi:hypothetical protein
MHLTAMNEPPDELTERRLAIRYWERKRLWYNAALVVPTILGFGLASVAIVLDDRPIRVGLGGILFALLLLIVAANLAFCLVYAFEFLWVGRGRPTPRLQFDRRVVFVVGLLVAAALAFIGGVNLAYLSVLGFRFI